MRFIQVHIIIIKGAKEGNFQDVSKIKRQDPC
jgi:hypothetical protein